MLKRHGKKLISLFRHPYIRVSYLEINSVEWFLAMLLFHPKGRRIRIFVNFTHEMAAFMFNTNKIHSIRVYYGKNDWFERRIGPHMATIVPAYQGIPLVTGRLSQTLSGAGKRLTWSKGFFVQSMIGQWRSIPMDGTKSFLFIFSRYSNTYCYDLKSATDSLPFLCSSEQRMRLGWNTFLVITKNRFISCWSSTRSWSLFAFGWQHKWLTHSQTTLS